MDRPSLVTSNASIAIWLAVESISTHVRLIHVRRRTAAAYRWAPSPRRTLLTADVAVSMPPVPLEWHGRDVVARFYASVFGRGPTYDLVPTRANGQLAFGAYLRAPAGGIRHGVGLLVLTAAGDQISALTRFDNDVLPSFGLPRSLPGR
jgi:hypothetical protein